MSDAVTDAADVQAAIEALLPLDPGMDTTAAAGVTPADDLQAALLDGTFLPVAPAQEVDPDLVAKAKSSWVLHGGNVAAVVRDTGLTVKQVSLLAAEHDWPLHGDGDSQSEKATRTRLRQRHAMLEEKMVGLLESMDVESKQKDDIVEKGTGSRYVASLSQRSTAFKTVFDAWTKVGAMIAPEVFAEATIDRHGRAHAQGGLAGVDRDMESFIARLTVHMAEEINRNDRGTAALEEAEHAAADVDYVIEADVLPDEDAA